VPSVGVVGAGTMGVGIVYVFAAAGCQTTVVEPDAGRVRALKDVVREQAARGLERGKITREQADRLSSLVSPVPSVADLPEGLDLVVESVPERLSLKHEVLAAVAARSPVILATNTSALSVDELAERLPDPETFLGMHFFNPVWSLAMVELIRGARTSPETLRAAQGLVSLIGKESIVVRDVPGFATSRLDVLTALEAMRMLEDGVASAEDIDKAMVLAYRHPMGPLRLSDVVGLDVRLDIARGLTQVYGERFAPPRVLVEKVAAGELGQKSGQGFFSWSGPPHS
jgi:3-hydroxybutyryl-CoA dehydrogenase